MTQRSSIHTALAALRAACNYSFASVSRFLQFVTFLTEPDHTTYINLDFHYQMVDKFSSALAKFHVFWWQHILHSRRLSIDKIPTRALLLQQFNIIVMSQVLGHMWPDQTRVSPRSPQGTVRWETLGMRLNTYYKTFCIFSFYCCFSLNVQRNRPFSLNLFLKTSLGTLPFIWKQDFIHLQIKLIFIWMVVHQASLWWRGLGELGNGLLQLCPNYVQIHTCTLLEVIVPHCSRNHTLLCKHGECSPWTKNFFTLESIHIPSQILTLLWSHFPMKELNFLFWSSPHTSEGSSFTL